MTRSSREQKQMAAALAVEQVTAQRVIGLGSGSTAELAIQLLAQAHQTGRLPNLVGIPSSQATAALAQRLGLPLTTLEAHPRVELTIDGADEISPELNLIKGGGGALLREKILAQASQRWIIIADESKLSPMLGTHGALPVEVIPFGWRSQALFLEALGARVTLRTQADGRVYLTDQGNRVLDCHFGPIAQPERLAGQLERRAGIVAHGLFLDFAPEVIVCGAHGCQTFGPNVRPAPAPPPSTPHSRLD